LKKKDQLLRLPRKYKKKKSNSKSFRQGQEKKKDHIREETKIGWRYMKAKVNNDRLPMIGMLGSNKFGKT